MSGDTQRQPALTADEIDELAGRARDGDRAALEDLLAAVRPRTLNVCRGVLLRSSAAAIVGYFVYGFVLPPLSMLLASSQHWWKQAQPWVDFNYAQGNLFNDAMGGQQWAQLAVTGLVWLVLPLAVGLRLLLRSEVK